MNRPTLYDISRPLSPHLKGWPSDTPLDFRRVWRQDRGASVNVGALILSVHAGTHADAPFHFDAAGPTVDALPLDAFVGRACVLDVTGAAKANGRITAGDLAPAADLLRAAPRLLLRTGGWLDSARFPDAVPVLDAPSVIPFLQKRGVVLVGLDLPSFDALDSKDLPVHHALAGANIQLLEGLDLHAVPLDPNGANVFELMALPLSVVGADAAPVRAVLRVVEKQGNSRPRV